MTHKQYFGTITSTNKCKNSIFQKDVQNTHHLPTWFLRQRNLNLTPKQVSGWSKNPLYSGPTKHRRCVWVLSYTSLLMFICASHTPLHTSSYVKTTLAVQTCRSSNHKQDLYQCSYSDALRNLHSFIYPNIDALKTSTMERSQIRTVMLSNPLVCSHCNSRDGWWRNTLRRGRSVLKPVCTITRQYLSNAARLNSAKMSCFVSVLLKLVYIRMNLPPGCRNTILTNADANWGGKCCENGPELLMKRVQMQQGTRSAVSRLKNPPPEKGCPQQLPCALR